MLHSSRIIYSLPVLYRFPTGLQEEFSPGGEGGAGKVRSPVIMKIVFSDK